MAEKKDEYEGQQQSCPGLTTCNFSTFNTIIQPGHDGHLNGQRKSQLQRIIFKADILWFPRRQLQILQQPVAVWFMSAVVQLAMTKLAIIAAKINEMAKEKQSLEYFCLKITAQLGI